MDDSLVGCLDLAWLVEVTRWIFQTSSRAGKPSLRAPRKVPISEPKYVIFTAEPPVTGSRASTQKSDATGPGTALPHFSNHILALMRAAAHPPAQSNPFPVARV